MNKILFITSLFGVFLQIQLKGQGLIPSSDQLNWTNAVIHNEPINC